MKAAGITAGVTAMIGIAWAAVTGGDQTAAGPLVVVPGATPTTGPVAPTRPVARSLVVATATPTVPSTPPVEPYVLGSMTWYFAGDAPSSKRNQITDSMNWTINQVNTLANYQGNVRTLYDASVSTANAGLYGEIRFGGQSNRRTALHELSHWLGSGGTTQFRQRVSGGVFTGWITTLRVRGYDGASARLSSDGTHFWPYGMNFDREFSEPQRTIGLVAAQRADMGWGDGTYAIAGNRRFQNRSSGMILDAGTGSAPLQRPNAASTGQTWKAGYVDGFVTLTGRDGLAIDSIGVTSDGGATAMRAADPAQIGQHWEMIPTDNGWFLLRNRATRKCLDNGGDLNAGAAMRVWGCGGHPNQQWHLVR